MSLSEVIASIVQPLFDLLPQIHERPASNEWLVVDRWFGGVSITKRPVLHIPAFTHCEVYPKAEMPIDTGLQTLTTADRKTVSVNATVILRIEDPTHLRGFTSHSDWEVWAAMRVRGCVQEVVTGHNWEHVLERGESFIEELVYSELHAFGIETERLVLEDITEAIPIRLLQPLGGE